MKVIALIGSPNVGKSVLFSRLTGLDVVSSNYPGTTVDFLEGEMPLGSETVMVVDAPGTYSLEPTNKAEEVAVTILDNAEAVINVVDATNLERNLLLTLEVIERGKPTVVALNMWDETGHLGISVNAIQLEEMLGVPVVPTVALSGEGIKSLVERLQKTSGKPRIDASTEDQKWIQIGHIVRKVQTVAHRHHTFWNRFSDATIKPSTGLPLGLLVMTCAVSLVRLIGETIVQHVTDPLFELCRPWIMRFDATLGAGLLHDVLIGKTINGEVDFVQSMGLLTTALYVPLGMVLPYIIAFYVVLAILEDSGYLPRLATLSDTFLHKLGMHGHGILPVFLGLGCNVPGVLSARVLETRKQRFIASTLIAISVPCMAQTAMIFGVLGPHGFGYILVVFATLTAVFLTAGIVLNRFAHGDGQEIFLEIPPYRRPSVLAVSKKTWTRVRWFIAEAIPYLFLGVLLVNILHAAGLLEWAGRFCAPVLEGLFGLPKEAASALLAGFLRKDLAVGMLLPLNLTSMQLVIAVTILAVYFPCVATFAVMVKELGVIDTLKATAIMVFAALSVGGALNFLSSFL